MKLALLDDIHLEFGAFPTEALPDADVLVLAGDICVATYLNRTRTDADARAHRKNCDAFFNAVAHKYHTVLYVLGNHEHYRSVFEETHRIVRSFVFEWPNIRVLERETIEVGDTLFYGATFWTDCNNSDPVTCAVLKDYLTDFRVIRRPDKVRPGDGGLFTPEYSAFIHEQTVLNLTQVLATNGGRKMAVISHHAPSPRSSDPRFAGEIHGNHGFYSNLEATIKAAPNIKVWFHGHMHNASDYYIDNTRVVCNPWGYPGERRWGSTGFNMAKIIEI